MNSTTNATNINTNTVLNNFKSHVFIMLSVPSTESISSMYPSFSSAFIGRKMARAMHMDEGMIRSEALIYARKNKIPCVYFPEYAGGEGRIGFESVKEKAAASGSGLP